ncbi:N-alpha-acetyltransferase 20 [Morella rubra]|uniref:N-alpha-acetyltransferase 20 n=1 Tax=Morella rubra TaxID=262757 RepID=A0A6A1UGN1_9ROSI|nr:N-alpha-acetyltransferase 20 [Morella rubra]
MDSVMGKVEGHGESWHGHVTAITVAPGYRRQQLAKKLMNLLEEISDKITYYKRNQNPKYREHKRQNIRGVQTPHKPKDTNKHAQKKGGCLPRQKRKRPIEQYGAKENSHSEEHTATDKNGNDEQHGERCGRGNQSSKEAKQPGLEEHQKEQNNCPPQRCLADEETLPSSQQGQPHNIHLPGGPVTEEAPRQ